ncbi:hypothetical protein E3U23_06780 [Erythrobacter litoralis]|uniref:hypothetical protein n=1 Tax=Erythrobacter litoralis TaxID=39960 RepID=UPI002434EA6A|nr:hypothetical protein [Erythrobacter litoralis]MDG6078896.1 hypothetical protein [Erythrobacter litoralis]
MRRNLGFFVSAAACCALLVACGGDDDEGTPSPTPTPTPTDSPAPSPSPTPTPTSTEFDFAQDFTASFNGTSYSFAYFTPTGGTEVWNSRARRAGTSSITYETSPEAVTFTFPDAAELPTFGGEDLETSSDSQRSYLADGNRLVLERPYEEILRVFYRTSQSFVRETVPGNLRSFRYALFFNPVTTAAALTAGLTYSGTAQIAGGIPGETAAGVFAADTSTLSVVAGTGDNANALRISGDIRIVRQNNGTTELVTTIPVLAVIADSGGFAGGVTDEDAAFQGQYIGSLAGANREEIFVIFSFSGPDDLELIGSYIGRRTN